MKKEKIPEVKKEKVQSAMLLFKTSMVGPLNPIELMILKNLLTWATGGKMTTINTKKYDNIGFWVSSKKAVEWGMSARKLFSVLKKMNRPLYKNDPKSLILTSERVHTKNRGSRTFIIFNPSIINQIIEWEALDEDQKDKFEHLINARICQRQDINIQTNNFLKFAKINKMDLDEISKKIKMGLNNKNETKEPKGKIIPFDRAI
ncbi:MAG: hypothetical protein A2001_13875 [Treponema sp. GWC1_61_84]|nr:MAG: hypothetical protein A2001_13875 [Treponema sp. GWC1_61_84]